MPDQVASTLESLLKRMDAFLLSETARVKEFADIKDTMSSSRGVGGTNLEVTNVTTTSLQKIASVPKRARI